MAKGLPKTAKVKRRENETEEQYTIRQMVAKARLHLLGKSGDLYPEHATTTKYRFDTGVVSLHGGEGTAPYVEYLADTGDIWQMGLGKQIGTAVRRGGVEILKHGETDFVFVNGGFEAAKKEGRK